MQERIPPPRPIHTGILLISAGVTPLATAILGPSLPKMQQHFATTPHADYLVPLSLTAPMLVMACLSAVVGFASDHFGRKRILVCATMAYAFCGIAPAWLQTLQGVLVSRLCLGAAAAAIMTVSTTMIGDYFEECRRAKLMSLQTTVAAVSALFFNILGGFLGNFGWRAPYSVFALALPLAMLMAVSLWEPCPDIKRDHAVRSAKEAVRFRVAPLVGMCVLALGVGVAFMSIPVHLGYLLASHGTTSSGKVGFAYALNSVGVISGTLLFGWLVAPRNNRVAMRIALASTVFGLSFFGVAAAGRYCWLALAGYGNGVGAGLLLPTMVIWNMHAMPPSHRGLGIGAFQASMYLGMFLNPVLTIALPEHLPDPSSAMVVIGVMLISTAITAMLTRLRRAKTGRAVGEPIP